MHNTSAIFASCCLFFSVPAARFVRDGRNQHRDVRRARHVAFWLLHAAGLSYPETARAMGLGDHTTAMYAVAKVEGDEMLHRSAQAIREWLDGRGEARRAA